MDRNRLLGCPLQLLVNLVGIVFAGVLVLVLRRRRDNHNRSRPLPPG